MTASLLSSESVETSPITGGDDLQSPPPPVAVLKDAAQWVRGPLNGIRQSLRTIQSGSTGQINAHQQSLIAGALHQCELLDFMTGEMSRGQWEGIGGVMRYRRWTELQSLVDTVQQAAVSMSRVYGVGLRIDVGCEPSLPIYADADLVTRLATHLIMTAMRHSAHGQNVCLRIELGSHGESVCWKVIDQGQTWDADVLSALTARGTSLAGSAGLGLSLARRLTSSIHSTLQIRTRGGRGSETSFTLPAGGAASIATVYARWRLAADARSKPRRRPDPDQTSSAGRRVAGTSVPGTTVVLGPEWRKADGGQSAVIGTIEVGALVPRRCVTEIDQVLQRSMSPFDLLVPIAADRWIYCLDVTPPGAGDRIDQVNAAVRNRLPEARLQWSNPRPTKIGRNWVSKLSDVVVRQTLIGTASPAIASPDEVRPGTAEIGNNEVAAQRLDAEMRHLGRRLAKHTDVIHQQAAKLRRR